jgi:hypothetical protein
MDLFVFSIQRLGVARAAVFPAIMPARPVRRKIISIYCFVRNKNDIPPQSARAVRAF